jgi:hypothetical protein
MLHTKDPADSIFQKVLGGDGRWGSIERLDGLVVETVVCVNFDADGRTETDRLQEGYRRKQQSDFSIQQRQPSRP